ncbi:MAG: hypothetical protein V4504_01155 [Patescibacteria group bacterium]
MFEPNFTLSALVFLGIFYVSFWVAMRLRWKFDDLWEAFQERRKNKQPKNERN